VAERFLAFHWCRLFERLNKPRVARWALAATLFLSMVVHSWAPWLQRRVLRIQRRPDPATNASLEPTSVFTWLRREQVDQMTLFAVKDYYNVMLRWVIAHASLLCKNTGT